MSIQRETTDPFGTELDQQGLLTQSVRGSAVTTGTQTIKMIIQFVSQIILARLLFPADFGLLAMVAPVVGFLQIFSDVGLGQALIQRERLTQQQVSSLFWFNITLGVGLALVVVLIAPLMALLYHEPRVTPVMACLGCIIPLSALTIHPNGLLLRRMRFSTIAVIEVIAILANFATTISFALHGLSYWSLVAGQAAATATTACLLWLRCPWRPSYPSIAPETWHDIKFGATITGTNLATFASTSGDNIIVGLANGRDALGLYDRSYKLVVLPLQQVMTPLNRVAVPLLSRLRSNPAAYRNTYLQITRTMLLITVPMMIVCVECSGTLIHFLLGPNWTAATPVFSWVCVGGFTSALYGSFAWLFISQGRGREMASFAIMAAAINVASFAIGALWGIVGVAGVSAVSFACLQTPLVLYGATRTGPVCRRDLWQCIAPYILSGVAAAFALRCIPVYFDAEIFQLIAATVQAYCVFALSLLVLPGGRRYFSSILRLPGLLRSA